MEQSLRVLNKVVLLVREKSQSFLKKLIPSDYGLGCGIGSTILLLHSILLSKALCIVNVRLVEPQGGAVEDKDLLIRLSKK